MAEKTAMEIEQKVFRRKRFVLSLMKDHGFRESGDDMVLESDFMGGDFHSVLTVFPNGSVSGKVIDVMNEEEYYQLRNEDFDGAYVNSVRTAYRELLEEIASSCCRDVLFASDQANRITELILGEYGVSPDFPWDEDPYNAAGVFRHAESRKWFGLIMNIPIGSLLHNKDKRPVDVINLKLDTDDAERIRSIPAVFPAFHMNHKLWISVVLDDTVQDEVVMALVYDSFRLTGK